MGAAIFLRTLLYFPYVLVIFRIDLSLIPLVGSGFFYRAARWVWGRCAAETIGLISYSSALPHTEVHALLLIATGFIFEALPCPAAHHSP